MSTVLWANQLGKRGKVISDESDKWALYRHTEALDQLACAAGLQPFSSLIDDTDLRFNLDGDELPAGVKSTRALMARQGVWKSPNDALAILEGLLAVIATDRPRFGVQRDDVDSVVAELSESIAYAQQARDADLRFNFSVVM
jgi:hypothetical protein